MSSELPDLQSAVRKFVVERFPPMEGDIELSTPLLDSGLVDSIGILEIVDFVEERFDITLEDNDLVAGHFSTVSSIALLVQSRM